MNGFILSLLIMSTIVTPSVWAQEQPMWPEELYFQDTTNKANRVLIAKELVAIYESINASIPSPKPNEVEWVKKEKRELNILRRQKGSGDAYNNKYNNLWSSKEYHFYILKERLENILFSLRRIAKQANSLSLREEMTLWAETVYWISSVPTLQM